MPSDAQECQGGRVDVSRRTRRRFQGSRRRFRGGRVDVSRGCPRPPRTFSRTSADLFADLRGDTARRYTSALLSVVDGAGFSPTIIVTKMSTILGKTLIGSSGS